jgi:2-amino-4-hydroxy-6-hydroxymethyldihydropteridine diphosphokinase
VKNVYIGLGTNLGDREENFTVAKQRMSGNGIVIVNESAVEETEPVEYTDQPMFLNQTVCVETGLAPRELLDTLLAIEQSMGRIREIPKGPRIIDLDILLYGDLIIDEKGLVVPHRAILSRNFLVRQIVEIDPQCRDPRSGRIFMEVYDERYADKIDS